MRMKQGVQQELMGTSTPVGSQPAVTRPVEPLRSVPGGAEQAAMFEAAPDLGAAFIGTCPDCGSQLEFAEGCVKCHVCGFSECG
jgi:ribonucleoside-diphosphate reductase alpha chain